MTYRFSVFLLLVFLLTPSMSTAQAIAEPDYKSVIRNAIEQAIIPAYSLLLSEASAQENAIKQLCSTRDRKSLEISHTAFFDLLQAWSAAEMYRLGPSQENNRQERLFFWPDRKGRGLRQVRKILSGKPDNALKSETLAEKSVAVQGLTALEFTLFSKGSEEELAGKEQSYRCRYALAISGTIKQTTSDILAGWRDKTGYSSLMLNAADKNPVYKTDKEVIRDLLQKVDESILTVSTRKLDPMLKKSRSSANIKRAPFWRSQQTLKTLSANLQAVLDFQNRSGLARLLPEDDKYQPDALTFEIRQALKTLQEVSAQGPLSETLISEKGYEKLRYLGNPLKGAHLVLSEYYPEALGITMGFNSLDGD